jgi:divalent metal cation (Fe/Co/Zn/Cd) transporter
MSAARFLEETSSLVSSGALVALGLQMAMENMTSLQLQFFTVSPSIDIPLDVSSEHSLNPSSINFHAVWIALITVVVKEWLYRRSKCASLKTIAVC